MALNQNAEVKSILNETNKGYSRLLNKWNAKGFSFELFESYLTWVMSIQWFYFFRKEKGLNSSFNSFDDFMDFFDLPLKYLTSNHFSRAVRGENFLYVSRGGCCWSNLSQWAVYRIVAIDVRSRREGRDLRKVGFYDPIKNQTYLNVPAILYFLEKGAQPTETVYDILKRAEVFKEIST